MMAAGLMADLYIVNRGISEYADLYKNDVQQYYAVAAAAVYTEYLSIYLHLKARIKCI